VKTSVSAMNPSEPSGTETLRYNEFTLDDTEIRLYARLLLTDQTLFSIFYNAMWFSHVVVITIASLSYVKRCSFFNTFNARVVLLFSSKMKDVIDVLAMQREKRNTLQKSITIDYTKSSDSFTVSRFIFECGMLATIFIIFYFIRCH